MKELTALPVTFTEPANDGRIVVIEQVHQEKLKGGVKPYSISLTVQQEGENIVIPIVATEGERKTANSQLTLSIGEARELADSLERAITDAQNFVRYI